MLRIRSLFLQRCISSQTLLQNRQGDILNINLSSSFFYPGYVKDVIQSVIKEKQVPNGVNAEKLLSLTGYVCPGLSKSEKNSLSQSLWKYFLENGVCQNNPRLFDTLLNTSYENDVEIDLQSLLNSMKAYNAPVSDSSYRSVLKYFAMRGDIASVRKVLPFFTLPDGSLVQDVYFDLAIAYIKAGQQTEAETFLNTMKKNGSVLTVTQIDQLSHAYAEMGNIDQVFSTYLKHKDRSYSPNSGMKIYETLLRTVGIEQANKFLDIIPTQKLTPIFVLSFLKRLLHLSDLGAFHQVCKKCSHIILSTTYLKHLLQHKVSSSDIMTVASHYKWNIHDMIGSLTRFDDESMVLSLIGYADKTQQKIDVVDITPFLKWSSNGKRLSYSASVDLIKAASKNDTLNFDFLHQVVLPHLFASNRHIEDVSTSLQGIVDENLLNSAYLFYSLRHRKLHQINRLLHEQHQKSSSAFLNDPENPQTLIAPRLWLPRDTKECTSSAEMVARLSYFKQRFASSLLEMSLNVCEPTLLNEFIKAVKEQKSPKLKLSTALKPRLKRFVDKDDLVSQVEVKKTQDEPNQAISHLHHSTNSPAVNELTSELFEMDSEKMMRKHLASELSHVSGLNNLVLQCVSKACALGQVKKAVEISQAFVGLFCNHSPLSSGSDGQPRLVGLNKLIGACNSLARLDEREAAFNLLEAGAFCLQKESVASENRKTADAAAVVGIGVAKPKWWLVSKLLNNFSQNSNQLNDVNRLARVVEQLAKEMEGGHMPSDWLKSVMDMYLEKNENDAAQRWFHLHSTPNQLNTTSSSIVRLLQKFIDAGDFKAAHKAANDYVTRNGKDIDLRVAPVRQMCAIHVSSLLVNALMRSNKMEQATEIIDSLPKHLVADLMLLLYIYNKDNSLQVSMNTKKMVELMDTLFQHDPVQRAKFLKHVFNGAIGMHYASLAAVALTISNKSTTATDELASSKSGYANVIFTANIAKSTLPLPFVCDALESLLESDEHPSVQLLLLELRQSQLTKTGVTALVQLSSKLLDNELALSAFHRAISGPGNLTNYRLIVSTLCESAEASGENDSNLKNIGLLLQSLLRSSPRYARSRLLLALLEVMPEKRLIAWPDLEKMVLHFAQFSLLDLALQMPWQEVVQLARTCSLPQVGAAAEAAYWARHDALPDMVMALMGRANAEAPVDKNFVKSALHHLGIFLGVDKKQQKKMTLISKVMVEVRQHFPQQACVLANSLAIHLGTRVSESCIRASELSPGVRALCGFEDASDSVTTSNDSKQQNQFLFTSSTSSSTNDVSTADFKELAAWLVTQCAKVLDEDVQRDMVLQNVANHLKANKSHNAQLHGLAQYLLAHGASGVLPLRYLRDLMITDNNGFDSAALANSTILAAEDQFMPLQILELMNNKTLAILAEYRPKRLRELQMAAEAANLHEHPVARILAHDCIVGVAHIGSREFGQMLTNCSNLSSHRLLEDCFILLKSNQLQLHSSQARHVVRRVLFLDRLLTCKETKISELHSLRKATSKFAQSIPVAGRSGNVNEKNETSTEK